MEKIVEQGLLYDFYGELLTAHQRKIYEDAVYNDLSYSEIALEVGISRQAVHDLINRCNKILQSYEQRLELLAKFSKTKETLLLIQKLSDTSNINDLEMKEHMSEIKKLAENLLEEL